MIEDTSQEILKGAIIKVEDAGNRFDEVALYFDYIEDETLSTEVSITDNYVESNYSVQDHIAVKPKVYRLRGCVGEIVYQNQFEWIEKIASKIYNNPVLKKTLEKTKPIKAISPIVSNYTQLAINLVNQIESSYKRYKQMLDDFTGKRVYKDKRQQTVVAVLNQILQNRIPVKLTNFKFEYTPFKEGQYNKLYYLQSVSAHQGDNNFITDIEVTIKEFRIATTKVTALNKSKYGDITVTDVQKSDLQNEGIAKGQTLTKQQETNFVNVLEENREKMKDAIKNSKFLQERPQLYNWCSNCYHGVQDFSQKTGEFLGAMYYGKKYGF